jgi:hypothetical protein
MIKQFVQVAFDKLLSPEVKHRSERIILLIAIASYLLHLSVILLNNLNFLQLESKFFQNPIAAIYTPFSFILVYEVYLLIFFLPKSISSYIGKQYEIILLIVIRRIFKDLAHLELSTEWFAIQDDLQFTYDVLTALLLFFLIFYFYKNIEKKTGAPRQESESERRDKSRFILLKNGIAVLLVPLLIVLAIHSLATWGYTVLMDYQEGMAAFKNINNIFFDDFFSVLIIVDVLLLLASFFYSDQFHKIIRNSGFVISTILIKVSFSVEGLVNNALIIGAVTFGFLILLIHNKFARNHAQGVEA